MENPLFVKTSASQRAVSVNSVKTSSWSPPGAATMLCRRKISSVRLHFAGSRPSLIARSTSAIVLSTAVRSARRSRLRASTTERSAASQAASESTSAPARSSTESLGRNCRHSSDLGPLQDVETPAKCPPCRDEARGSALSVDGLSQQSVLPVPIVDIRHHRVVGRVFSRSELDRFRRSGRAGNNRLPSRSFNSSFIRRRKLAEAGRSGSPGWPGVSDHS